MSVPLVQRGHPREPAGQIQPPILAVTQTRQENILQPLRRTKKKEEGSKPQSPSHSVVLAHHQKQDRMELLTPGFALPWKPFLPGNAFLFHTAFEEQA